MNGPLVFLRCHGVRFKQEWFYDKEVSCGIANWLNRLWLWCCVGSNMTYFWLGSFVIGLGFCVIYVLFVFVISMLRFGLCVCVFVFVCVCVCGPTDFCLSLFWLDN